MEQRNKRFKRTVEFESYADVFLEDILKADKEIIISSPAISMGKIEEFVQKIAEGQAKGVKVLVITWAPEAYGYGDSGY